MIEHLQVIENSKQRLKCIVNKLIKVVNNYWNAEDTNIFKNYTDALAGLIVLVIVPALSIIFAVCVEKYTFWNYTFPLLSISLAGIYDNYGRYEGESPKNLKLAVRTLLDFLAIFFAALCIGMENIILPYISPILLCICGLLLVYEIYNRVKTAILISPWSV